MENLKECTERRARDTITEYNKKKRTNTILSEYNWRRERFDVTETKPIV